MLWNTKGKLSTSHSLKPVGDNCEKNPQSVLVEIKSEGVECNGEYETVISSSQRNSFLLSHSKYESDQKNIHPTHRSLPNVHVQSLPESSVQKPDSPGSRKAHAPSVQKPDFKESGRVSSQCRKLNEFGIFSGINNTQTLNAESFQSEQENFPTSAQSCKQEDLPPTGAIYLLSGWYMNVGAAYCGGCQLNGTLLQKLQMC